MGTAAKPLGAERQDLVGTTVKGAKCVRDWLDLLDQSGGPLWKKFDELYGHDRDLVKDAASLCRATVEAFIRHYSGDRSAILARATGRINLMGMHVDHRGGSVNPISLKQVFLLAEPRDDDVVVVRNVESEAFPGERFSIHECLPDHKIKDWDVWCHDEHEKRKDDPSVTWSNYVRAPVLYLQHLNTGPDGSFAPALRGMNIMIGGDIPRAAGLSTSSSIVVAATDACLRINGLELSRMEFIDVCGYGEWYVGTRGGSGDHAAIKFGEPNAIGHMTSFPLSVDTVPFPPGYKIVLANSLVEASKRSGARDAFNNRVASYIFGLMLIRKRFPEYAPKLEHLRDVNPGTLGVDEAEIYRVLKCLPECTNREEILGLLQDREDEVRHVCRSHAEPEEGYKVRQVCMYGIAECLRSDMAPEFLRNGNLDGFAELIELSHDGDRVTRLVDGERVAVDNGYPDTKLDTLIEDLASDDPERREQARLWRQPGGYDVSVPEIDMLVDSALESGGVLAAGLVGAGLGGSVIAIVKEQNAPALIERLAREYYGPRNLPVHAEIVSPVAGADIIDLWDS